VQLGACERGVGQYFQRVFGGRVPCCHLLSVVVTKPVMLDLTVLVISSGRKGHAQPGMMKVRRTFRDKNW
jgi:hypothetical protein